MWLRQFKIGNKNEFRGKEGQIFFPSPFGQKRLKNKTRFEANTKFPIPEDNNSPGSTPRRWKVFDETNETLAEEALLEHVHVTVTKDAQSTAKTGSTGKKVKSLIDIHLSLIHI